MGSYFEPITAAPPPAARCVAWEAAGPVVGTEASQVVTRLMPESVTMPTSRPFVRTRTRRMRLDYSRKGCLWR
ncbi:hypothetical protein CLM62_19975 [Streptomyces sp. SA15]|nr:hypothetical protein CLM62_19975 [Streptomyces sp. SA15]